MVKQGTCRLSLIKPVGSAATASEEVERVDSIIFRSILKAVAAREK